MLVPFDSHSRIRSNEMMTEVYLPWGYQYYTFNLDDAIEEAIHLLEDSYNVEREIFQPSYYLAKLYQELYYFCSNENNFDASGMSKWKSLAQNKAGEYYNRYVKWWNEAIQNGELHALVEEALALQSKKDNQVLYEDMLFKAAKSGYPVAIYYYAKTVMHKEPKKALDMIARVQEYASVKKIVEQEEKGAAMERELEKEEKDAEDFYREYINEVDWREESGWNDVYGRGVEASDIIEFR